MECHSDSNCEHVKRPPVLLRVAFWPFDPSCASKPVVHEGTIARAMVEVPLKPLAEARTGVHPRARRAERHGLTGLSRSLRALMMDFSPPRILLADMLSSTTVAAVWSGINGINETGKRRDRSVISRFCGSCTAVRTASGWEDG